MALRFAYSHTVLSDVKVVLLLEHLYYSRIVEYIQGYQRNIFDLSIVLLITIDYAIL